MEKTSQKTWFVILFLILFFPIGLYLMWSQQKFSKGARIIISVVLATFIIAGMTGTFGNSDTLTDERNNTAESSKDKEAKNEVSEDEDYDKSWLTKADWAALENYAFAVAVKNYDGDIFVPGKYSFAPNDWVEPLSAEKTPIVWDVYVSKNYYTTLSELKEDELKATVGGVDKTGAIVELEKGDYVYVKYIEVFGEPHGWLEIRKQ